MASDAKGSGRAMTRELTRSEITTQLQRCAEHQASYGPQHTLLGEKCWCYGYQRALTMALALLDLREGIEERIEYFEMARAIHSTEANQREPRRIRDELRALLVPKPTEACGKFRVGQICRPLKADHECADCRWIKVRHGESA